MSTQKKNITKASKPQPKDRSWILTAVHVALICIAFAWAYSYAFSPRLDLNGDNAKYIELARSLAGGHGFATEGTHFARVPHTHFPPGYPVLLSIPIILGADNLILFKIMNGLMMLAGILLFYLAMSKHGASKSVAFASALIAAVSPQLLHFASMVMSEMSFMFFMMLALYALSRMVDEEKQFGPWFWTACASAAACYYIRAAGSAVIFSVLVFYLFRKEWKRAAVSVGTVVALYLPWFIRNKIIGNGRSYTYAILARNPWRPEEGMISSFSEFMHKVWKNLNDTTLSGFIRIFYPSWKDYGAEKLSPWFLVLGFVILAVVLWGLWSNKKMRFALLGLLLANTGLLLIWNGGNDIRYVTPFIPLVIYGFWNGVYNLIIAPVKERKRKYLAWLPYLAVLSVFALSPKLKTEHQFAKAKLPAVYADYYEIAKILNDASSPSAKPVVACRKPELFKYYAPKTVPIMFASTQDAKALIMQLVDQDVDYVVLDHLGFSATVRYLFPAVKEYSLYFKPVKEIGEGKTKTFLLKFDRKRAAALE